MQDKLDHTTNLSLPFSGIDVYSKNIGKIIGNSGVLSTEGIYIETNDIMNNGMNLLLEFRLPEMIFSIKTYSQIVYITSEENDFHNRPHGIYAKFIIINDLDEKSLVEYINKYSKKIDSESYNLADFVNFTNHELPLNDLFSKTKPFQEFLQDWKQKGYYIAQKYLQTASENRVILYDDVMNQTKEVIMMGNSNYLGLTTHPKVVNAAKVAIKKFGTGSVGSPMHTGSYSVHLELEQKLAEMKGCEDAMIFSSGYTANVGCISGLLRKDDVAIIDKNSHRSIIDGCMQSASTFRMFRHSDMNSLEKMLNYCKDKYNGKIIIVDGVYSAEGDIAPLPEIVKLSKKYDAKVMVDDAHATGVIGDKGRGTCSYYNMDGQVDIVMGTLSKALGGVGGFVASSKDVISYLRHYASSALFSATIPPSVAASVCAAIDVMQSEPERIQTLWKNINYMKDNLISLGYNILESHSSLISIVIGEDLLTKKISKRLFEEGIYFSLFLYPAVPKGQERIRLSLMSTHTKKDLDDALCMLDKVAREFDILNKDVNQKINSDIAA